MRILLTFTFLFFWALSYSADYYWVGGSGNWSDISHWAAVSGGSVKYPVAPSSEDNVIFDENSFTAPGQIVSFKNNIIFCKTMDWSAVTNSPTLEGPVLVTISIFGDLILSADMNLDFKGTFLMTGIAEDKSIELAGNTIPGVMSFAGESHWSVLSNTQVDSTLEISRGTVSFNGNDIECKYFHINSNGVKNIDISNSNVLVTGAYRPEFGNDDDAATSMVIEHNLLTMNADGSMIEFTAPNAVFRHPGGSDLTLGDVYFSAGVGLVRIHSDWYDDPIQVNTLRFASSALVEGTINANNLRLAAGGRYRFGADRTYIFGSIDATSDCVEGIAITSNNPGFSANFEVTGGDIDLNFITLRDIHGVSSGMLNADNGVDLGNNTGWNFTNSTPVDYFWIGGTGSWDDPVHWSLTSGGSPAGCVPSGKDNAFFDENSFSGPNQSVNLNSRSTFIHDMTWNGVTNDPEFTGLMEQRMVITGSLELDIAMEHDIQGFYDFESSEMNNTIRMNGNIFNESISFSGVDADWTLLDDLEAYRRIYFNSGKLISDGHQITTTRLTSYSEQPRSLDISDSYLLLRESLYLGPEWIIDMENFQLEAANSIIEFTARATFQHEGRANLGRPHYHQVFFNNERSAISSRNELTPESETAVIVDELTFQGRGNFAGSSEIGLLRLADGFSYVFDSYLDRKQVIGDIITQGTCENGTTLLFGSLPGERGNIELLNNETLERMYIYDIEILGATLTNNNSIDGGNNQGMTFNELQGRTLYWVGNSGVWQEPAHWSLTSGGPGGECIPTALDNVIFDANSFDMAGQVVEAVPSQFSYCKDLTILQNTDYPQLRINFILVNGSMDIDDSFLNNVDEYIFTSLQDETVFTRGQELNNIRMRGGGHTSFEDDLSFNNYIQHSGDVTFASIDVVCNSISIDSEQPTTMSLGSSTLTIYESGGFGFDDNTRNFTLNPGTSELILLGEQAGIFSRSRIEFNKVTFTSTTGKGFIASRTLWDQNDLDGTMTVASLNFNGDGEVIGHLESDTLIGVAGKIYTLNQDRDVDISSYFQLRGNNCTPIELRSSGNAVRARINMPASSEILVDFVQMKDTEASGGADFNAGSRSVDVGNSNLGWTFQDAPDFIESGFLGMDRAICEGEPVSLSAFSYSPNEVYLWSNGSTDSSILVTTPGTYFVEVQFESNCVLQDSIDIFDGQIYNPALPDSTIICADDVATIDVTVPSTGVYYLWNSGSEEPIIEVSSEGKYTVEIEALGCVTRDSTFVSFVEEPGEFLPEDARLCEGEEFDIMSMLPGEYIGWQDGSTVNEYTVQGEGVYWLDLEVKGCIFRDTLLVEGMNRPELELGEDTTICENTMFTLELNPDLEYAWQDGSNSSVFVIEESGIYSVTAKGTNGCESEDSLSVVVIASPQIDLGEDIESCESSEITLRVPAGYSNFEWEDGSSESTRNIREEGEYTLTVIENGCEGKDDIFVSFLELPQIELGPSDTLVCEGVPLKIQPVAKSPGDLSWQDLSVEDFFVATAPGKVTATVFNGECYNSDSITIAYRDCVFFDVFIPNAFSPNDDGFNDRFEIFFPEDLIIQSYTITIFDRWGNRVYDSQTLDEAWDGKLNTDELGNGVYVYMINLSYIDENGPGSEEISGDIAIFR